MDPLSKFLVGEKPFVHWRSKKQLRSAETMEQRRGARSSIRRIANCCAAAANAPRAALSLLPCAVLLPLLSCARRNYSQLSCLLCENEKSRAAHCGKSLFLVKTYLCSNVSCLFTFSICQLFIYIFN